MTKKIYVVDDTDSVREIVIEAYNRGGYETKEFSNADSLLEAIANEEKPDLILMDTDLPNLLGYIACRTLKGCKHTKEIKIIGMSGRDYRANWIEAKADYYVSKPFNLAELLTKTKELLGE